MSRTTIDLDEELIKKGLKLSGFKTKQELVNKALADFVRRESQKEVLNFFGKLEWGWDGDVLKNKST